MPGTHSTIRFASVLALALGLTCLACSAATAGGRAPLYAPSPHGPYRVGVAPTALMTGDFDPMGTGFDDVLVGYAEGRKANVFYVDRHGRGLIGLEDFEAPIGPSAFAGSPGYGVAILSSGSDQARQFLRGASQGSPPTLKATVRTGVDPVAAVIDDFVYREGDDGLDLAVVNRGSSDLSMFEGDFEDHLQLAATVPLGPEPTAAVGHECCIALMYVTTAGDDRVTLLQDFRNGSFGTRLPFPVGDRPSALAVDDLVRGDFKQEEIAVANRGSDDVTVLDSPYESWNYRTTGTYSVGDEPVAIEAVRIDEDDDLDLAVVNAGSDDVSILLNDGHGRFHPGGTFPVGRHPVALASVRFDRAFGPDLVVANRGSDDLTVLLRHESGHCRGREAREVIGTAAEDRLMGGAGPDELEGQGGPDELDGRAAGDCLRGGDGDDTIKGGRRGDLIRGGPGADRLFGEGEQRTPHPDNDTIFGGPGRDEIHAGPGDDRVFAADGERDFVDCGHGRDTAVVDRLDQVKGCEIASSDSR